MSELDAYLQDMLNAVKEKFPDLGLLLVAVEDGEDDNPELTVMTNMCPEEMQDVLGELVEDDIEYENEPERLVGAPAGVRLH
jgi:hypothetical protein